MQPSQPKHDLKHQESSLVKDVTQNGILVIGEVSKWTRQGRELPQSPDVHCIEFHELTIDIIELLEPTAVFSPLLCTSFDCLDVAVMLQALGFKGRYRVMGESLPNPQLIRSEIQETCPNIDFDIVNLGQENGQRTN